ncbi:uncharacterized protein LOC110411363 [Herrania umbratica]|uniref:Uncharacterized protein LOC110411363 n=1 Tax=Herrania umbratica TaxID=108875 RepID=A0A6J0ZSB9_9ROSI|nr:uncharacterized protein LOC110411363 [Herrania umbratica]
MATSKDDPLDQREDPRLCFLENTNRQGLRPSSRSLLAFCRQCRWKVIGGNSQRRSTNRPPHQAVPSPGNNLPSGASSSGHSTGLRTWRHIRGILNGTHRAGESSRASNPALAEAMSSRDSIESTRIVSGQHPLGLKHGSADEVRTSQTENLANSALVKPTGFNKVKSRSGHAQQHQYNKTGGNPDSAPLVKKSGSNRPPVSRLSKQQEETIEPLKHPSSSFRSVTSRIQESKQRRLMGTTQPLQDPTESAKMSTISRIRASMRFVKKERTQPPKNPTDLVENGGIGTILASKHVMQKKGTAQPPKDPARLVRNIGTVRIPVSIDSNIGTSRFPVSIHRMQRKETTQSPKDSAALVKKNETTSRFPIQKQVTQKKEKSQPSKGTSDLVSKSATGRTLPSVLVTGTIETTPAKPRQKQLFCTYEDHIVWEGFDERIVPLGKSCLLCDGDLASKPEHGLDIERLNPSENAVLSCGHVYHSQCLQFVTSEEKSRDPPCIICASILS